MVGHQALLHPQFGGEFLDAKAVCAVAPRNGAAPSDPLCPVPMDVAQSVDILDTACSRHSLGFDKCNAPLDGLACVGENQAIKHVDHAADGNAEVLG